MNPQSERGDAGEDLEAGHVFPQRAELLPPLHHQTQQAAQNIRKRGHHLLHQVSDIVWRECFCFNRFTSFIICLSIYLFWRLFLA